MVICRLAGTTEPRRNSRCMSDILKRDTFDPIDCFVSKLDISLVTSYVMQFNLIKPLGLKRCCYYFALWQHSDYHFAVEVKIIQLECILHFTIIFLFLACN